MDMEQVQTMCSSAGAWLFVQLFLKLDLCILSYPRFSYSVSHVCTVYAQRLSVPAPLAIKPSQKDFTRPSRRVNIALYMPQPACKLPTPTHPTWRSALFLLIRTLEYIYLDGHEGYAISNIEMVASDC